MGAVESTEISIPERIGDYRLGEKLGQGGMGVVYLAHDEVLERDVAIKLLRADRTDEDAKVRMLREAKALAKLSHPNIVPIYGAGEQDGLVYLAMERVEGRSLHEIRDDATLDWRARRALYLQAARGLAAAHDAGLVHRDFKPSNVLVGHDGRVRVLDFGLARDIGAPGVEVTHTSADTSSRETDAMAGTPAYMAPEQRLGEGADARADQYSLCVCLWEALFAVNPIRKTPLIDVVEGELNLVVPRGSVVPKSVVEALRIGLRREPAQRHRSMAALVHALEATPGRKPLRMLSAGGVVVAAASAMLWVSAADDPCDGVGEELSAHITDAHREAVSSHLYDAGVPGASVAAALGELDTFTQSWSQTRAQVCEAYAAGNTSEQRYTEQRACLDASLQSVVAVLELGAFTTRAFEDLRSPKTCAFPREPAVGEPPPPPPGQSQHRAELRRSIAEARALIQAMHLDAGEEVVASLEERVGDDEPMQAEVVLLRAHLERHRGQWVDASASFERAFRQAESSGYALVAAQAATWMVTVVGDRLARKGEGEVWATVAQTKVAAVGGDALAIDLALARGSMATTHAEFEEGDTQLAEALRLARAHWGGEHLELAAIHEARGRLALSRSELDQAQREFETALDMRRALVGLAHPQVADAMANLGQVALWRGDLDAAREGYGSALKMLDATDPRVGTSRAQMVLALADIEGQRGMPDIARAHFEDALASLPPGSERDPIRAEILASFASFESREGDYARGVKMAREALDIQERVFGRKHPTVAVTYNGLGTSLQSLERNEEARRALQRAVDIHREVGGERSAAVAPPLSNLALTEHAEGNLEVARSLFEEVLSIEAEALGDDHPNLVFDHYYLAQVALADARLGDAVEHLEHARTLRHPSPAVRAEVLFALAQTKAELKRPWRDVAAEAREAVSALGEDAVKDFDAWVDSQG